MFSLFIRRDGLIDPPQIGDVDHHCHILPSIDDGPATVEGSLAIAGILLSMGITTVTATPHVISDVYPNSTEKIINAVKNFKEILMQNGLPLKIDAGAEYYTESSFIKKIEAHDILSFGEKNHVLFESPVETPPILFENVIFHLKSNGYTPLLAHAERYRFLQKDWNMVKHLKNLGVDFQANHPSFMLPKTSHTGEMARKLYLKGYINALGTDMHKATPVQQAQNSTKAGFNFLRHR